MMMEVFIFLSVSVFDISLSSNNHFCHVNFTIQIWKSIWNIVSTKIKNVFQQNSYFLGQTSHFWLNKVMKYFIFSSASQTPDSWHHHHHPCQQSWSCQWSDHQSSSGLAWPPHACKDLVKYFTRTEDDLTLLHCDWLIQSCLYQTFWMLLQSPHQKPCKWKIVNGSNIFWTNLHLITNHLHELLELYHSTPISISYLNHFLITKLSFYGHFL